MATVGRKKRDTPNLAPNIIHVYWKKYWRLVFQPRHTWSSGILIYKKCDGHQKWWYNTNHWGYHGNIMGEAPRWTRHKLPISMWEYMCNGQHTWDLWGMVIKHHEWDSLNLYCWPEELDHGTSTTGDIAYKTKLRLHPFLLILPLSLVPLLAKTIQNPGSPTCQAGNGGKYLDIPGKFIRIRWNSMVNNKTAQNVWLQIITQAIKYGLS